MDNLPIVDTFEEEAIKFIVELWWQFPIKHHGELKRFLGIHVKKNWTLGTLSITTKFYWKYASKGWCGCVLQSLLTL